MYCARLPKIGPVAAGVLMLIGLGFLATSGEVRAGQCLADFREVKLGDGRSVKLRDYYCRPADANANASIRVQFHRLTDYAFMSWFDTRKAAGFAPMLQGAKVLPSAPLRTLERLMNDYAIRVDASRGFNLQLFAPKLGEIASVETSSGATERNHKLVPSEGSVRTLGGWDTDGPMDFPALDVMARIKSKPHPGDDIVRFARSLKAADLRNYQANLREYNRRFRPSFGKEGTQNDVHKNEYVALLADLARDGLPDDFGRLFEFYETCNGDAFAALYPRRLLIDVALIENTGTSPIRIDQWLGAEGGGETLRKSDLSKAQRGRAGGRVAVDGVALAPGERAVWVRRLTFVDNPPGQEKKLPDYVYGGEIHLAGFVADGERYSLEESSANFLSLTLGSFDASCPYLLSWQTGVNDWIDHGKVIAKAKGRAQEGSETRKLDGLVTRFRLVEKEVEVARIDRASLLVRLKSGALLSLQPELAALKQRDRRYHHIYFGEQVEFNFTPPGWLQPDEVESSEITIEGYYERYSDILAARHPNQCVRTQ